MEYIKNLIEICNNNAGFFSFILSALTLVVTTIAVFVAIYAAKLPYKKDLKVYTSVNEDSKGTPVLEILLLNTGNCTLYLEDIFLTQPQIMPDIFLGSLRDDLSGEQRILIPNIPYTHKILMRNYNEREYAHTSYPIKIEVMTTNKTFNFEVDWASG